MSNVPYIKNMSTKERAELMKAGAFLKLAHLRVAPDQSGNMIKKAITFGGTLDAGAKSVVIGSLLTGVPVGIMAHMISKKVNDVKRKERELKQKIDYYRQATEGLETGLAGAGIKV